MKDFFKFQTDYPSGSGFPLFGLNHILWLLAILFVCIMSTAWYVKLPAKKQRKVSLILGIALPVMGIYRDVILWITGHYDRGFLPLHLCSMALWIGAVYVVTRIRYIGVVYVLLCVPGAISALLFPDWNMYPFLNYMHIHAFLTHGVIVILGIWLAVSGEIQTNWKDLWMPVSFAMIGAIMIYLVNRWLGTNYWFLNTPSQGSPLVFIYSALGENGYLAGYALLCVGIVILWSKFISFIVYCLQRR